MISSQTKPFAKDEIPSKRVARFFFETKSVFVTSANFLAREYFAISAARNSSPAPEVSSAGRHIMTISTESRLSFTTALRRWPSRVFGLWMPGVSTSTAWYSGLLTMPRIAWRVVLGCGDVIAILLPTSALMRVDFPVLGRPTIATKPERKSLMNLFSHYIR